MTRVSARRIVFELARLALVGAAAATVLGFLGPIAWFFDLFAHFRAQYVVVLLAAAVAFVALRRYRLGAAASAFLVLDLAFVAPLFVGGRAAPGGTELTVLVANVNTARGDPARVRAVIDERRPDVVGLLEVDEGWLAALEPTLRRYPYRVVEPRPDNFGVALYSMHPLEGWIARFDEADLPSAVATLGLGERRVRLVLTHPLPPVGAETSRLRDAQLEWLATLRAPGSFVLLGDLNTSPWSPVFRRLCDRLALEDARDGFGLQTTWPSELPLLAIPIDHILVSADVGVRHFEAGPETGSDHRPVIAVLSL